MVGKSVGTGWWSRLSIYRVCIILWTHIFFFLPKRKPRHCQEDVLVNLVTKPDVFDDVSLPASIIIEHHGITYLPSSLYFSDGWKTCIFIFGFGFECLSTGGSLRNVRLR